MKYEIRNAQGHVCCGGDTPNFNRCDECRKREAGESDDTTRDPWQPTVNNSADDFAARYAAEGEREFEQMRATTADLEARMAETPERTVNVAAFIPADPWAAAKDAE